MRRDLLWQAYVESSSESSFERGRRDTWAKMAGKTGRIERHHRTISDICVHLQQLQPKIQPPKHKDTKSLSILIKGSQQINLKIINKHYLSCSWCVYFVYIKSKRINWLIWHKLNQSEKKKKINSYNKFALTFSCATD